MLDNFVIIDRCKKVAHVSVSAQVFKMTGAINFENCRPEKVRRIRNGENCKNFWNLVLL